MRRFNCVFLMVVMLADVAVVGLLVLTLVVANGCTSALQLPEGHGAQPGDLHDLDGVNR